MSDDVTCSVCGREVGRGPDGLGIKQHSAMHRRQFEQLVGREPEDYDEVREVVSERLVDGVAPEQLTLSEVDR